MDILTINSVVYNVWIISNYHFFFSVFNGINVITMGQSQWKNSGNILQ